MIPLDTPYFPNASLIKSRIANCIESTWVGYQGKYTDKLIDLLCTHYNRKFAIPVNSGTQALYMAVACLDLPIGSEVIVPTNSYSGNVVAITMNQLTPKFIDCDYNNPNTNAQIILSAITNNTKAIMIPHMYGHLIDLSLLDTSNLKIIEDTTQTMMNSSDTNTDIICVSFHNKIITSGEGGAVVVDDEDLFAKLHNLWLPSPNNDSESFFMSGRLSNVSCAIAVSQMETLDEIVNRRNLVADYYNSQLDQKIDYDVCWRYQYKCKKDPKDLIAFLKTKKIQSRQVYRPMHYKFTQQNFPNAEYYFNNYIDLPSGPALTKEKMDYVCKTIKEYTRFE